MAGDKTAIVTGAGSGIGKAVATTLLKAGWNTVFCGRRVAMLEAAITEAGDVEAGALAVGCDITRPQEVEALFGKAVETFGRVDLLFNNAGISGKVAPVHELPTEDWDRIVRINLRSMFLVLKASVKAMIEAGVEGSIVNMGSSMAGWDVLAGGAGYASTKHGVVGLTRVAALDAAPYGIRVNAICPGVIETTLGVPAADKAQYLAGVQRFADRIPLRRIGQPEDVAAAVAFLASDDARHVTGVDWLIDGGQTLQSWANAPEAATFPDLRRNAR